MKDETQQAIREHAVADYPRESCGLVQVVKGRERYRRCANLAATPGEHFVLSPEDYASAEDEGEIIAVVHSHPDVPARPSEADRVACETSGLPWHIVHVSVPDGGTVPEAGDIVTIEPQGYEAPLIGRPFAHGVLDCYSLVCDWYRRELGIDLPDYPRRDDWWLHGEDLYMQNFAAAGCAPIVGAPQRGDIILMQIRAPVVNHAAVYLGDGNIIHHLHGRLSSRDVYGGQWAEVTRYIVRHREARA